MKKFILNRRVLLISSMFASFVFGVELLDLEKHCQDFVLETKQIIVPGFPGAFNPSIARWHGKLLMSFRVRNDKMVSTFDIGMVWLDNDFNPVGEAYVLDFPPHPYACPSKKQDPRLIVVGDKLYMVYSDFINVDTLITRRMFITPVHIEGDRCAIDQPLCLHPFEDWSDRWEKNWPPFVYDKTLLLAYSLFPHRILHPSPETGTCTTTSSSHSTITWDWGTLRGGTPALKDGNHYLGFFHSSKVVPTIHSQGKAMQHYVMGAYTFSAQPPFEITGISPEPIVGKKFYYGPGYNTWKPLRVVFPMGLIIDDTYAWVTYGRQDFEIWVVKLDKKGLYDSLVPCAVAHKQEPVDVVLCKNIGDHALEYECS